MGLKYEPSLDGLRAISALLVVILHCETPGFQGGFVGVDVFFVLSGFLITSLLREELARSGKIDVHGFMKRRARRLYPALLFMLVVMTAIVPGRFWEAILSALYITDITSAAWGKPGPFAHTWSLAIEAQFYLLWPFILPRLKRPRTVLGLLFVALTAARCLGGWQTGYFLHASGLVLGALITYLPRAKAWMAWPALAAIAAVVIGLPFPTTGGLVAGITIAELASAVLISSLGQPGRVQQSLSTPWLVWLGSISYAIYLWHYPVTYYLKTMVPPWYVTLSLALPATIALATISMFVVEKPASRLRLAWRVGRRRHISNSTVN